MTLAQTAQIVRALEASPIVARTTVNTASTTQGETVSNDDSALVQAHVLIHLQKEAAETCRAAEPLCSSSTGKSLQPPQRDKKI